MSLKEIKKTNIVLDDVKNIDDNFKEIGIELSNRYLKSEVNNLLNNYYTKSEVNLKLDDYYTKNESDLSYPFRDEFNSLETRVDKIESSERFMRYGVRKVLDATTATLERLGDAVGLVAEADSSLTTTNTVENDFDNIYPWSHMRKCVVEESGRILYEEYPNYSTSDGDYMIEVPEFYIKHTNDGINLEYWVSAYGGQGYEKVEKFYISQFKTTNNHKSRPYAPPLVNQSRAQFRTGARNKGAGWQIIDMKHNYYIRVLYQVEFAHLNSQNILGTGVTGVRYTEDDLILVAENNTNRAVVSDTSASYFEVGETISIGTARGGTQGVESRIILAKNSLGNNQTELVFDGEPTNMLTTYKVYSAAQHSGKTLTLTASSGQSKGRTGRQSITYRGIEDFYGNVYDWTDGLLINDHQIYVCDDPEKYADTLTGDFRLLSYSNIATNGYPKTMGYDSTGKYVELPTALGGSSSTGYCDYYYQNTGVRAPRFGGNFNDGSNAGIFLWRVNYAPGYANVDIGSRLIFKKP